MAESDDLKWLMESGNPATAPDAPEAPPPAPAEATPQPRHTLELTVTPKPETPPPQPIAAQPSGSGGQSDVQPATLPGPTVNPGAVDSNSLDEEIAVRQNRREQFQALQDLNNGDSDAVYNTSPEMADEIIPPQQSGWLDYGVSIAKDVGRGILEASVKGVAGGAADAINEMSNAADSLGDWLSKHVMDLGAAQVFDKEGNFDPKYFKPGTLSASETGGNLVPSPDRPKTITGGAIRSVAQFVTGFYTGGKVLGGLGVSQFLPGLVRVGAQGAFSDAFAFDPHQERLSNMLAKGPAPFRNAVTEYLAAKPDDSEAEGRLKNAIEGLGLGNLGNGLARGLKLFRDMRNARELSVGDQAKKNATVIKGDQEQTNLRPAGKMDLIGDENLPLITERKLAKAGKETQLPVPDEQGARALASAARIEAGGKEMYVNFARINSSEDVKAVIGQMADAYAGNIQKAKRGIQTHKQTIQLADSEDAWKILMERQKGQPLNAEQSLAARNLWTSSAIRLQQVADIAANSPTPENLFQFRRMLAVTHAIQKEVIGARTETARALNAWAIPSGGDKQKFKSISDAIERSGGEAVSTELAKRIAIAGRTGQPMSTIMAMAEKGPFAKTLDSVHEYWVNALLSGPKTHIVNTLSNTSVIALSTLERGLAARISQLTGQDGVEIGEALAQFHGFKQMAREAISNAAKAFRTGQTGFGVNKIETPRGRAISSGNYNLDSDSWLGRAVDALGATVNVPGKALQSEDEFFKTMGYRMELNAQSYRTAMQDARAGRIANTPDAIKSRMADILADPPESLQMSAASEAAYRTFTADADKITSAVMKLRNAIPGGRWVLPFVGTPSNILRFSFARTPLAPLSASYRAAIAKGGADAAIARARMGLGTMLLTTAADMAMDGKITGSGPPQGPERDNWLRQGNRPYSIKIGDHWVAYNRLDPTGFLFGISADAAEYGRYADMSEEDLASYQEMGAAALFGIAQNLQDKSYLQGASMLIDAINDPKSFGPAYAERLVASFIPAAIGEYARFQDPVMRSTYDIVSAAKNRLPGSRESLAVRRDLWGRPMSYESGFGKAYDALSPMYGSTMHPEPIDQEMQKSNYFIGMPAKHLTVDGEGLSLRNYPDIYSRYLELQGATKPSDFKGERGAQLQDKFGDRTLTETLNDIVTGKDPDFSEGYKNLSDNEDKKQYITRFVSAYRKAARDELLLEYPDLQERAQRLKQKRQQQDALPPEAQ